MSCVEEFIGGQIRVVLHGDDAAGGSILDRRRWRNGLVLRDQLALAGVDRDQVNGEAVGDGLADIERTLAGEEPDGNAAAREALDLAELAPAVVLEQEVPRCRALVEPRSDAELPVLIGQEVRSHQRASRDPRLEAGVDVQFVDVRNPVRRLPHGGLLDQHLAGVVPQRADHEAPGGFRTRFADVRPHLRPARAVTEDRFPALAGRIQRIDLPSGDRRCERAVVVHHLDHHPLVVRPVEPADGGFALGPEDVRDLARGRLDEGERALSVLLGEHGDVRALGRSFRGLHLRGAGEHRQTRRV